MSHLSEELSTALSFFVFLCLCLDAPTSKNQPAPDKVRYIYGLCYSKWHHNSLEIILYPVRVDHDRDCCKTYHIYESKNRIVNYFLIDKIELLRK